MKRALIAIAAAAAITIAAACEPQMQISPVLNRDAFVQHGATDSLVVMGTISCTRSERVDLFPTLTQGELSDRPGEISVACDPGTPKAFTATFDHLAPGFTSGPARLSVDFCTNPSRAIDEDCATASRSVDLHEVAR